jgi:hypothetical protein
MPKARLQPRCYLHEVIGVYFSSEMVVHKVRELDIRR